jgi:hypothetical protein
VINLDEYYRAAIGTIVNRGSREAGRTEIDQLVFEVGTEYGICKRRLDDMRGKATFSSSELRGVLL